MLHFGKEMQRALSNEGLLHTIELFLGKFEGRCWQIDSQHQTGQTGAYSKVSYSSQYAEIQNKLL